MHRFSSIHAFSCNIEQQILMETKMALRFLLDFVRIAAGDVLKRDDTAMALKLQ